MSKKRILWVGEASFLRTGFSGIAYDILTKLFATNKYEIAELGAYSDSRDSRILDIPWKFYSSNPDPSNELAVKRYNSSIYGQFGEAVFEDICLDFKPDIVLSIRDHWMDKFIEDSPFRKYFKWIYCPTIDGEPQRFEWIDTYRSADYILTYSRYGKEVLGRESEVKPYAILAPGTNHEIFVPMDKTAIRKEFGIPHDANIILTVMRNQRRKLFPDLFEAFKDFLQYCIKNNRQDLYHKTFLQIHTSYPDVGFDLARHILQNGIGHKVLASYICHNCRHSFVDFFQSEITTCKRCGMIAAKMPNTMLGIDSNQLAKIYNIADLYVQYSICLDKNQDILCDTGWKKIKDINQGDLVFTHKNRYKKVIKTIINPSEYINNIKIFCDYEQLKITDEHPVYSISRSQLDSEGIKSTRNVREIVGDYIRKGENLEPKFTSVKNLQAGDLLLYPIDMSVNDLQTIDLLPYIPKRSKFDHEYIYTWKCKYKRYIDIDEDFCKFIGIFAANGSWNIKTADIRICMNKDHTNVINFIYEYLSKISGKKASIRPYSERNAVDVGISSALLKNFLEQCGKHEFKQLPNFVDKLPISKQAKILEGLFLCDGCNIKKDNSSVYCTISEKLSEQIKNMLRRHKINFSAKIVHKKCNDNKKRKPQFTILVSSLISTGEFRQKRSSSRSLYINDFNVLQIKSIERLEHKDKVYNLEVEEDNSYTTKISAVHNCEGLGLGITEAKSCGIPAMAVDYSAMAEQVEVQGCKKIAVEKFFHEPVIETEQIRALPDKKDTVRKWFEFFNISSDTRKKFGEFARQDVIDNYSFERSSKIYQELIDKIEVYQHKDTWDCPNVRLCPNKKAPNNFDDPAHLIDWCIDNILGKSNLKTTYWRNKLIKSLNVGYITVEGVRDKAQNFSANDAINMFIGMAAANEFWEKRRVASLNNSEQVIKWDLI